MEPVVSAVTSDIARKSYVKLSWRGVFGLTYKSLLKSFTFLSNESIMK